MSQRKAKRRRRPEVAQKVEDNIVALLRSGLPAHAEGQDMYLTVVAKAMGVTYKEAYDQHKARNPAYITARNSVKTKLFSIVYSDGMSL